MPSSSDQGRATPVVRPALVSDLVSRIDGIVLSRVPIREWWMSSVSRVYLTDGRTVILKCAVDTFNAEPAILDHTARHGVPVPEVLASKIFEDGRMAMLIEDLGEPVRDAGIEDAARAAVAVHSCPPIPGALTLDYDALVEMPARAITWLKHLQDAGRWLGADDLRVSLDRIADVAERRARGVDIPPFGTCHSEFHPTSIHIGTAGMRVLDWARAYNGPGLFDLVSWQGTLSRVDPRKVNDLLNAYVAAGGPAEATAERGKLPASVWAAGWDMLWVSGWFIEQAARWQDPADDEATQGAVRRHIGEAVECLLS